MKKNRIIIFDTTLRDGEQCPGASMTLREKLEVARQLARLKVDVIEGGFPVISERLADDSNTASGKEVFCSLGNGHFFQALNLFFSTSKNTD